ncbi:hypothetical protein PVK06_027572 [Gossypium arboreum]|uniref:Uncharacterized protein n=1 Tax=Gossypium arboreum TaxID=29729 RepID=A0ABR0P0L9_GOSAR|nr:hypothetical protein PVK06_027572 [Gossypium arboreum]
MIVSKQERRQTCCRQINLLKNDINSSNAKASLIDAQFFNEVLFGQQQIPVWFFLSKASSSLDRECTGYASYFSETFFALGERGMLSLFVQAMPPR